MSLPIKSSNVMRGGTTIRVWLPFLAFESPNFANRESRSYVRIGMDFSNIISLVDNFCVGLGLTFAGERSYYGYYRDFPFACNVLVAASGTFCTDPYEPEVFNDRTPQHGLLFQFRHVRDESDPLEDPKPNWDPPLAEMIADETLKIEIEDGITWVTFYKPLEIIRDGTIGLILDTVVMHLQQNGYESLAGGCHYCREHQVSALTFENDRVGQMCDVCLEPYLAARKKQTTPTARGLLLAGVSSIPGVLYGALVWAVCWLSYLAIYILLDRYKIGWIPAVLLVGFMFVVGGGVGWIVTWSIRKVKHRGDISAGALAVVMATLCVLLGELLFGLIAVHWFTGILSIALAFGFVTEYWVDLGFAGCFIRGCTAIITVALAGAMARPELKKIPL